MVVSWSERVSHSQRVLNELPVPEYRLQRDLNPEVAVRARVVWEHDGEEWRETTAYAWAPGAVLVLWHDRRRLVIGIWLPVVDVERL